MSLNDIKIGPKLIGGFCVVALIALAVGGIGILNIKKIDTTYATMYNSFCYPIENLRVAQNNFQLSRLYISEMIRAADRNRAGEFENKVKSMAEENTRNIEELEKRVSTEETKKLAGEFSDARKVYRQAYLKVFSLGKEGNFREADAYMNSEGARASAVEEEAIVRLAEKLRTEASRINDENTVLTNRSVGLMAAVIVIGFIAAVLIGIYLTLSISRPLAQGIAMMKDLALGRISRRLKISRRDEVGELAGATDDFAEVLQKNIVQVMHRIAGGDVSMQIELRDAQDEIAPAMKKIVESLRALIDEATLLSKAAVEGKLKTRGNADKFQGGYREIVKGVNDTLDAVVTPLNVAANYVERISKGDIPEKITANYNGDFNEIKNNLNTCIDAINALIAEANGLANAVEAGNLAARADLTKHQGDFRKVIEGFNASINFLATFLDKASGHLRKLSNGEVPEHITREYKGQLQEFRNDFNTLFTTLRALVADINVLTGAAVAGQLSERADAMKHKGEFRKIIEGVNTTLDGVVKPIQEASAVLDHMANNDLSTCVTGEYNGDLALIKNNINKVLDTLNESLGKVAEAVSQVASASQQLSSTAEEMSAGAEQQTTQTGQVATSMEEMSATVQEVAKNSNLAADSAQAAGTTATKGGEVVEQTVNGMHRISDSVRDLQQVIEELSKNSEKIGDIVSVIDDVADQTNLLALNAAIEAARAGEQGRGFAVVADEVRKLAERTTTSTKEIAAMVKTIQEDTSKASSSMEHSAREVESGMEHAASAGSSLREIVAGAHQVQEMVKQIATAAEQQSAAAEEISSNIESIASVSKQNAQGAQQTSSAAQELSGLTDELQSLVGRFRLKDGMVTAQVNRSRKSGKAS